MSQEEPKMKTLLSAALLFALLAGCSPDPGNTPKIAEGQRNALEKAEGVQDTLNQAAEEQQEKIDQQTE
jgi:hypothetical protein